MQISLLPQMSSTHSTTPLYHRSIIYPHLQNYAHRFILKNISACTKLFSLFLFSSMKSTHLFAVYIKDSHILYLRRRYTNNTFIIACSNGFQSLIPSAITAANHWYCLKYWPPALYIKVSTHWKAPTW